jgi:predicted nucleic acid-binding protein
VTIYSNTTPLLAFSAIGRLDLMNRVHGEICIVPSVVAECGAGGVVEVPDLTKLPWIRIEREPAQDESRFFMLDAGERDTLSAALRDGADLVLIDERLGRNLAEFYGVDFRLKKVLQLYEDVWAYVLIIDDKELNYGD